MKISKKKYKQLIEHWNSEMVVYIRYTTKHSIGKMTLSVPFFLEYYRKIERLFKGCIIREIFVKNEKTQVVLEYFKTFGELWFYAIGR